MALSTTSIKTSDVKTAIGASSNSTITLCKANVNKWSAHKPFRSSAGKYTYAELTAALKLADYGLDVASGRKTTPKLALDAAAGNAELWPHLKPLGTAASPCRLGDFRGYNPSAPVPFSASVTPANGIASTSVTPSFAAEADVVTGSDMVVADFATFTRTAHIFWCVLYRKVNATTTSVIMGGNVANNPSGYGFDNPTGLTPGDYEMCMALYSDDDGGYWPLPGTYRTVSLRNMTVEEYTGIFVTFEAYCIQGAKDHLHIRLSIRNTNSASRSVAVSLAVKDGNNVHVLGSPFSTTKTISAGATKHLVFNDTGVSEGTASNLGDIMVEDPERPYSYTYGVEVTIPMRVTISGSGQIEEDGSSED